MTEKAQEPVLRLTRWRSGKTYQPDENVWHDGRPYRARCATKSKPPSGDWEPLIYQREDA